MNKDTAQKKDWRKTLLPSSTVLKQAIRCLDESAMRIVLIVDSESKLLGTVSDGDIRRGLLRGLDLESPVSRIIQKNPMVVTPIIERSLVLQLMTANKIQQIPVVDEKRHVVGLHLWDEVTLNPARQNLMVIMAGGLGRRLRPLTESCPKPMIPVAGRPMLEHIIERAKSEGFSQFVLAIHYLGKVIENHFGDGKKLGVKIKYLKENKPLGTAGALCLLNPMPQAPLIVTNGDVMADIRYGEMIDFHVKHHADATMAVRVHEMKHPFGVVRIQGLEIIGFEEKPVNRSHINAGVYAFSPEVLKILKPEESIDMPALFQRLKEKSKRIVAYPMHEPWLDVGEPKNLKKARSRQRQIKKNKIFL